MWPFSLIFPNRKVKPAMDKALLVGINSYPGAPLSGCLNDIADMKKFLIDIMHFDPNSIHVLTERDATAKNILSELNWFVETPTGVQPAQCRRYHHYSGHGAQTPIKSPTEPDGLSECICPVDFDWSPGRMVTDKQYVQIFSRMPAGVRFNWASDSCHSGDLERSLVAPASNNPHPKPLQIPKRLLPPPGIMHQIMESKKRGLTSDRALINGVLDVGYLSGCQSDQTSADTSVNGRPCGAFTHYYLQALHMSLTAPWTTISDRTHNGLSSNHYDQIPHPGGLRVSKSLLG